MGLDKIGQIWVNLGITWSLSNGSAAATKYTAPDTGPGSGNNDMHMRVKTIYVDFRSLIDLNSKPVL